MNRDRLQKITDIESQAAWCRGYGSDGELDPERTKLIEDADKILAELEKLYGLT